jgi:hypothetical protein
MITMSFNRSQRRGETFQKGEPDDHLEAKEQVARYAVRRGFYAVKEYPIEETNFKHQYDVVIFPNKLYLGLPGPYMALAVVEIGYLGDNSRHAKTHGPIAVRDSIVEGKAKEWFPYAKFTRINKGDCKYTWWLDKHLELDTAYSSLMRNS